MEHTEHELVEQPKLTHHKKKMSEKDRERERLEVLQARKALDLYRKKQEDLNRPLNPREALKRTADNNWVHVTCAVFTTEVKFGNAKAMEPIEGIPSIPRSKYEEICDGCNRNVGPCVSCPTCRTSCKPACFITPREYRLLTIYRPYRVCSQIRPPAVFRHGRHKGLAEGPSPHCDIQWCKRHHEPLYLVQ